MRSSIGKNVREATERTVDWGALRDGHIVVAKGAWIATDSGGVAWRASIQQAAFVRTVLRWICHALAVVRTQDIAAIACHAIRVPVAVSTILADKGGVGR